MRVLSIVGARPQFIKLAPVHRALEGYEHLIVHTGQHYDFSMDEIHWRELGLPSPDYHLGVGSGSNLYHLSAMISRLEPVLRSEEPDWVLVYGDANSTAAGALATRYSGLRLAHVEAGLRSRNMRMVEEVNRILADHLSDILFAPTRKAVENLEREGVQGRVSLVGDVMVDSMRMYMGLMRSDEVLREMGVSEGGFFFMTLHRAENVDVRERLGAILESVREADLPVLFPVHPRTRRRIEEFGLKSLLREPIIPMEPLDYVRALHLIRAARKVLTDSGGIQKEAYILGTPCITLREETEWVETVEAGWNVLVGASREKISRAMREFEPSGGRPAIFGDGRAAERIVSELEGAF